MAEREFRGYCPNGMPRVYGTGETADIAETRCHNAALDYVRRRPDTGPLVDWTFQEELTDG